MNSYCSVPRRVMVDFAIDTNRINARQKDAEMNQLEKWAQDGVIQIEIPLAAVEECERGIGASARAQKVSSYVQSITAADSRIGNDFSQLG